MAEQWMLVWHLPSPVNRRAGQGPVYKMLEEYDVVDVWMTVRTAPLLSSTVCDILVDGVSIFSVRPQVSPKQVKGTGIFLDTLGPLREDSLVSLNVDETDGAEGDLTVGLILERRN